jgi:hypothetical protein
LLFFQLRIVLLEFFDELGDVGLITVDLFGEFHGCFDNPVGVAAILCYFPAAAAVCRRRQYA